MRIPTPKITAFANYKTVWLQLEGVTYDKARQ